ncbi:MAG: hypothetical protein WCF79_06330, partial [Rhodomicrobium sp.]
TDGRHGDSFPCTAQEERQFGKVGRPGHAAFIAIPWASRPLRDPNAVLSEKGKTIPHLTLTRRNDTGEQLLDSSIFL